MISHLQRDHNQVTLEINKHLLPAEPGFVQWAAVTTGVVRGDAVLSARTFKILHVMIASVMGLVEGVCGICTWIASVRRIISILGYTR